MVTSITLTGILIYLGAFVFALLLILKQKKINISQFSSVHYAFLIYIFAFVISKLTNSGLTGAFHSFCRCCQDYFVFLWVLSFLSNSDKGKNKEKLKYLFLFAGILSVVYGLMQVFHLDIFNRQDDINRLSGFHKNSYSYGGQLIVFSFLFLSLFLNSLKDKFLKSAFYFLILIGSVYCILNTFERAVILGFLIGLVSYFLFEQIGRKNIFVLSGILLFVIASIRFQKKLYRRIKHTIFPKKNTGPNIRFRLWEMAIAIWKRNIFFGVEKFPSVVHQPGGGFSMQVLTHAHNVYLQILVVHGLVGLLAFLNLIFSFLKVIFNNLRSKYVICLLAVIVSFLVEGVFEYFWGDSEVRYLLIYFIGFVFGQIEETKA